MKTVTSWASCLGKMNEVDPLKLGTDISRDLNPSLIDSTKQVPAGTTHQDGASGPQDTVQDASQILTKKLFEVPDRFAEQKIMTQMKYRKAQWSLHSLTQVDR
jgi:hypothetical protein